MTIATSALGRAVGETDFMRRARVACFGHEGYKEWLHFAVHAGPLGLLLNFSLFDAPGNPARRGARLGRLTCFVRHNGWDGDVDSYGDEAISVRGGAIRVHFGACSAEFDGEAFRLRASLARRPISLDLTLRPEVLPSESHNVFFDDCPPMSWVVVPRLRASGFVELGTRRHDIADALAYHDHNWGHFRWGKNFAWEWGYGLPEDAVDPWTFVFVRFMDRARISDLMRGLLVWKGSRQAKIFRGDEVTVRYEGLRRQRALFKLPRAMALAAPSAATDVPERMIVSAMSGLDRLDATFEVEDYAQLIVPNDDGLGLTLINEVMGRVTAEGRIRGDRVAMSGPSTFEFLNE